MPKNKKPKSLIAFFRVGKVVYDPMPDFFISNTVSMPAYRFYGKIEQYVRNNKLVIPVNKKITWRLLTRYNKSLRSVQKKLVPHRRDNISVVAWNDVANKLVTLVKAESKQSKKELELV
jgi:hypothetical protein